MNSRRLLQALTCAVFAFAVTAPVLARDDNRGNRHHQYDRRDDRRGHDNRYDRRHDNRHAYRQGYQDGRRHDNRYDRRHRPVVVHHYRPAPPRVVYHHPAPHRWARGQRYHDYYRGPVYVVHDYGRYHVRRPPHGYHWVRDDRGNLLMVAIATGIIADIVFNH